MIALKYDKNPFTVNEKGQDTVIYNYLLLIPLEDIDKIKHYSVNNTKTDIDILGKTYQAAYSMSMLIHQIVKGSLNGAVRLERKAAGQCQYCGREFKKSIFGLKCPSCKIKKDY